MQTFNMKKNLPLILAIVGTLLLLPAFFLDSEPDVPKLPDGLEGVFIDSPAVTLPQFSFVDHNDKPLTNDALLGKWSLIFFGYTSCPDVCPTTMSVLEKLNREASFPKNTQTLFVSLDPQRDTSEILKEFVGYFNDDFIGATGETKELDKFQEPLGVIYGYEGDTSTDDYIVNHFAAIHVIDPTGKQRAYILPPHSLAQVSTAYKLIYNHYNK